MFKVNIDGLGVDTIKFKILITKTCPCYKQRFFEL